MGMMREVRGRRGATHVSHSDRGGRLSMAAMCRPSGNFANDGTASVAGERHPMRLLHQKVPCLS